MNTEHLEHIGASMNELRAVLEELEPLDMTESQRAALAYYVAKMQYTLKKTYKEIRL